MYALAFTYYSSLRLIAFAGLASQWVLGILSWISLVLGLGQTLILEAGDPNSGYGVCKFHCTDVVDPLLTELFPQQQRIFSSLVLTSICCWFLIKENCVLWTFTIQYVDKCFGSAVWKHLKKFKNPKPSNLIKIQIFRAKVSYLWITQYGYWKLYTFEGLKNTNSFRKRLVK